VAAIGYPASDGDRNDQKLMDDIFGGTYDVKRFSPGLVTGQESGGIILLTDYTTLGGNSGSPVIRLDNGEAIALHFAGAFKEANYAVSADIVASAWARLKTTVAVEPLPATAPAPAIEEAPTTPAASLANRDGYNPAFLGKGKKSVPLPSLGKWAPDVAPVSDDPCGVLRYRHFSVIQSASRRLPLLTAVNIDGSKVWRLKREGDWKLDGRVVQAHQVGNELYTNNPFDRGHMVRRRDPGWGRTRAEAEQGEVDTFHYTNSVPQHEDLNQREWVALEDYILESVETRGFRATVFTGPVLREDDRKVKPAPGRPAIQIPEEFWKIAVIVDANTGKLSATGYVLSQGRMIRDLVEAAFVFGQFKTYQVQIARIEQATGLDFGKLREFDPLGSALEATFVAGAREVRGPGDLRLRP
jgi:endonuclease G